MVGSRSLEVGGGREAFRPELELTDLLELFLLKLEKNPLLDIDRALSLATSESRSLRKDGEVLVGDLRDMMEASSDSLYEPDRLILDRSLRTDTGLGDCGDMGGELGDTCKLELEGLFVNPSWAFGFVVLADALEPSLAASVGF